jgi:tripartite-type tricarboxylate transporter receptor subunit TctC
MVFSKNRLKELPNTPTAAEIGYEKLLPVVALDYMIGAPPGMSEGILKIWRDTFDKANADQEFVDLLTKQIKMTPGPLNGEQTAQRIKDTLDVYGKYKSLLMEYVPK